MSQNSEKKWLKSAIIKAVVVILIALAFIFINIFTQDAQDSAGSGCYLRYGNKGNNKSYATSGSFVLNANGNYKYQRQFSTSNGRNNEGFSQDQSSYGNWLNTGQKYKNNDIRVTIKGEVSLCRSYIPLDTSGSFGNIPIPRVGESKFTNIAIPVGDDRILFQLGGSKDKFIIKVSAPFDQINDTLNSTKTVGLNPSSPNSVQWLNSLNNDTIENISCNGPIYHPACGIYNPGRGYTGDCDIGTVKNFPVCGESSCLPAWCSGYHVGKPEYNGTTITCKDVTGKCFHFGNLCYDHSDWRDKVFARSNLSGVEAERIIMNSIGWPSNYSIEKAKELIIKNFEVVYKSGNDIFIPNHYIEGITDMSYSSDLSSYYQSIKNDDMCNDKDWMSKIQSIISKYRLWLNYGKGLVISEKSVNSTNNTQDIIQSFQVQDLGKFSNSIKIPDFTYNKINSYISAAAAANPLANTYFKKQFVSVTGGYIISYQHSKCLRFDGIGESDDVKKDRGAVEYVWLKANIDPNETTITDLNSKKMVLNKSEGKQHYYTISGEKIKEDGDHFLWMRIVNSDEEYINSIGSYNVEYLSDVEVGSFVENVINPLNNTVKSIVKTLAEDLFSVITCDKGSLSYCYDFIFLIRVMLIIYVSFMGFNFILGRSQITAIEYSIIFFKIAIISGLINGTTFEFFRNYVYPLVIGFSDNIITSFSDSNKPFDFVDDLGSYILFSELFLFQVFGLFSISFMGFFYSFIVVIAVIIYLSAMIYSLAAYFLAKLMLGVLLGFAPFFLIAILFPITKSIFDTWVSTIFQYIFEPIIIFIGFRIMTGMFEVTLDGILDFSVCIKCALPFKIPLSFISSKIADFYLFCITWFAPWGLDLKETFSLSISDLITLLVISMLCLKYVKNASVLAQTISGGYAPSSTSMAGRIISGGVTHSALNNINAAGKSISEKLGKNSTTARLIGGGLKAVSKIGSTATGTNLNNSSNSLVGGISGSFSLAKNMFTFRSDLKKLKFEAKKAASKNDSATFEDSEEKSSDDSLDSVVATDGDQSVRRNAREESETRVRDGISDGLSADSRGSLQQSDRESHVSMEDSSSESFTTRTTERDDDADSSSGASISGSSTVSEVTSDGYSSERDDDADLSSGGKKAKRSESSTDSE